MSAMLIFIEILLFLLLGFPVLYLAVLSILALTVHLRYSFPVSRLRKFAIVIPAHNEEQNIEPTLHSLFALDYPRKFFEVIVIADNCTDGTAFLARRSGASTFERQNPDLRVNGHA